MRTLTLLLPLILAQDPAASTAPAAALDTLDGVLGALYGSISRPAGAEPDWATFRGLFVPGAGRLTPILPAPQQEGRPVDAWQPRVHTVEEFIERSAPYYRTQGFFEREVHREVHRFGQMAQVFSTYESRRAAGDPEPFQRGINSIQLVHDGRRWHILSILWQAEDEGRPIPSEFLGR